MCLKFLITPKVAALYHIILTSTTTTYTATLIIRFSNYFYLLAPKSADSIF